MIENNKQPPSLLYGAKPHPTAVLVLADGQVFYGQGIGKQAEIIGEVCFNTGMTGYQETLSDPSYAGQIITFTTPHVGNVGCNTEDYETPKPAALGCILRDMPTTPSNWRSQMHLHEWLIKENLTGMYGVDTRALTHTIRTHGAPSCVVCYREDGMFDIPALTQKAKEWPGLKGMNLADQVTGTLPNQWQQTLWQRDAGYGTQTNGGPHIVAIDYGAKHNIMRHLAHTGCKVTIVKANATAEDILNHKPDGLFLSNGPGDPAACTHAIATLKELLKTGLPTYGICLGHQLLALALGGKTEKMQQGHRGANHPVKELATGKIDITSQNHGFKVMADSLPQGVEVTHISLFDGSVEGLRCTDKPVFSTQFHPEAAPGPNDAAYFFTRFVAMLEDAHAA